MYLYCKYINASDFYVSEVNDYKYFLSNNIFGSNDDNSSEQGLNCNSYNDYNDRNYTDYQCFQSQNSNIFYNTSELINFNIINNENYKKEKNIIDGEINNLNNKIKNNNQTNVVDKKGVVDKNISIFRIIKKEEVKYIKFKENNKKEKFFIKKKRKNETSKKKRVVIDGNYNHARIKKIKNLVITEIINLLNNKIRAVYKNNEEELKDIIFKVRTSKLEEDKINNLKKTLYPAININDNIILKPKHDIIGDTHVESTKHFMNTKIYDIIKKDISKKYRINYPANYNELIIGRLIDDNKIQKFNDLLDLTFIDYFNYFSGKSNNVEINNLLDGMKNFKDVKGSIKVDKKHLDVLENFINNFTDIMEKRGSRKGKKKGKVSV